ncbi:MAG: hypothetical protein EO766_12325 [Hydrotalea sp. AMD]|uniref:hypothetical protein n=1 Tax=Hydrotalea sp. AMD TaxID=2501297 RepID=UPI0010265765|nr:hypothetical protein [Hydrotalea sp. AMD]RWZ87304.1 MAG: hypothetical protein EO766_12325 [Hydrotalea sp. AMD]
MIHYDPSRITVEIVRLKSVTTALGGSISVLDEENSSYRKEVTKRIKCPLSVARAFIQKHKKTTKYLIPVITAIVKYDDIVLTLERHPLGTFGEMESLGFDGEMKKWQPDSELNLDRYINPLIFKPTREWFFDGRYIYSFNSLDIDKEIANAQHLTEDGQFRKLICMSIDTQELANADKITPTERTCVTFVSNTGQYSISPPIWKDLSTVGANKLEDDESNPSINMYSFNKIDEQMSVNLNFALAAGRSIGSMFGYNFVEPLQLPRLMIDLHTVNLPNVPKQIRATYDIGIRFTHAMAWLLGLLRNADNLDNYIMMRSLMKYLTQKGVYRNTAFKAQNVFQEGHSVQTVPLKSVDELLDEDNFTRLNLINIIEQAKSSARRKSSGTMNIGGLISEV